MFNIEILYNFFKKRIQDVKLQCVNEKSFALPNISFNPAGKDFWIELNIVNVGSRPYTESIKRSVYIAYITCCVPAGTGIKHISNVSSKISDLFYQHKSVSGGYIIKPVGELYIIGLDKETGYIDSFQVSESFHNIGSTEISVYKQDIKVTFELFEKLI